MRVKVIVGFVDKDWYTLTKGLVVDYDEAYVTTLIDKGLVEIDGEQHEIKARKASKKNARKTVLPR